MRPLEECLSGPVRHGDRVSEAPAAASPGGPPPWEAELQRLRDEAARQGAKAKALFERLEAVQAEFEEYRSQVHRDMAKLRDEARKDLIVRLLDVTDSLDHAIEFAGGDEALHEGLVGVLRQLRAVLDREGVQRIQAEGRPLNPELHEVVMREVTAEYREGTIISEMAKGYLLRGKVIRRAKVKVAVAPPPAG